MRATGVSLLVLGIAPATGCRRHLAAVLEDPTLASIDHVDTVSGHECPARMEKRHEEEDGRKLGALERPSMGAPSGVGAQRPTPVRTPRSPRSGTLRQPEPPRAVALRGGARRIQRQLRYSSRLPTGELKRLVRNDGKGGSFFLREGAQKPSWQSCQLCYRLSRRK